MCVEIETLVGGLLGVLFHGEACGCEQESVLDMVFSTPPVGQAARKPPDDLASLPPSTLPNVVDTLSQNASSTVPLAARAARATAAAELTVAEPHLRRMNYANFGVKFRARSVTALCYVMT